MRGAALSELPVPEHTAGQARRATFEVLARDEYAELRPGLLDRAWAAFLDLIGRLLELLAQTGQAGIVGSVILVVAMALLVVGAARLLRRVRREPGADRPAVALGGRSASDWAAEGREHEAAGRWRQAVRCHHRALVAELAAAGLVEEVPGRTAAEYEAEAARSVPVSGASMAAATRIFERAWYAEVPIGADDVADLQRAAGTVRRGAGLRPVPAGQR